jgi:hypothetical protein
MATRAHRARALINLVRRIAIMGKYILGWILGVPVIVLVIIYFIFN